MRIGLPPKPDAKQVIRISLPPSGNQPPVPASQPQPAMNTPAQKKATVRIGLPPELDDKQTIRISLPSGDVPALCAYPALPPAPPPISDFFQGLSSAAVNTEDEFMGSTRIVTVPVISKFYWLLGLNILAEFRGYAGTDQNYCFFYQGCLFHLARGSHKIRLAEDQGLPNFMDNAEFETNGGDEIIKPTGSLVVSKIHDVGSLSVVQRMRALNYMYEELLIENDEYKSKKSELLQQL